MHRTLGAIALAEEKYSEAVGEFRKGDMLPDGPADACSPCLPAILGLTFDRAGARDSAIAYYEQYLRTPSFFKLYDADAVSLARTYERLGALYEAKGDRRQALEYYEKFIDLWKNADPDLQPRVNAARARVGFLRGGGG